MTACGQDQIELFGFTVSRDSSASTSSASVVLILTLVAHAQPFALADRPRLHRHPRQRDRGAKHRHQCLGLQGEVAFCDQRRHHRARRLPLCAQAVLHQPGNVHAAALDRVRHRDPDRRRRQPARRGAGRDLRGHGRSVPHLPQGRPAAWHRRIGAIASASAESAARYQDYVAAFGGAAGLKGAIYGLIIIVFIVVRAAMGSTAAGSRSSSIFELFPLYKRATFKRQKIYVKSERNR